MKKLLTILLALLVVTGVVFADDDPAPITGLSDATLTLTSNVFGFIKHGFSSTPADSFESAGIGPTARVYGATNNTIESIDMAGSNELKYYNLWTNSSTNVTVMFTPNSMTTTVGGGSGTKWYVPYKLTATLNGGANEGSRVDALLSEVFGETGDEISSAGTTDSTAMGESLALLSTSGSGSGYVSVVLGAEFNEDNYDVLPEGDYTGTIVASIVTP